MENQLTEIENQIVALKKLMSQGNESPFSNKVISVLQAMLNYLIEDYNLSRQGPEETPYNR